MIEKIKQLSDEDLHTIWQTLDHYDPQDMYDEHNTMDQWAEAIYSEMTIRGLR